MKGKMAIIGDGDSVLAFVAGGIEAFAVQSAKEAGETIKRLAKTYQIIFIVDELAKENEEIISKYISTPYPIIIPVPSKDGGSGYGMQILKTAMDKALGVDILFGNED